MPLPAESYTDDHVLFAAASRGNAAIISLLLKAGCAVDAVSEKQLASLHAATENGHDRVVQLLVHGGAAPDDVVSLKDGSTPLHLAATRGHEAVVRVLVDRAFVNAVDDFVRTPLHRAYVSGHPIIVKMLLDASADNLVRDSGGKIPVDRSTALPERIGLRMKELAM